MTSSTNFMERKIVLNFADPSIYHDRILVVGGKKFHVVSEVLSLWSGYFRDLFNGNPNEIEFHLNDLNLDKFELFLRIVFCNSLVVLEVDDIIPLIELSQRFSTPMVLNQCIAVIDSNMKEMKRIEGILIDVASIYGIKDLKDRLTNIYYQKSKVSRKILLPGQVVLNFEDPLIYHDRVLIVEGKKFYVVSEVLSLWSEHFRGLFNGNFCETNKKEIVLNELDSEEFEIFIRIVYCNNLVDLRVKDIIPLIELSYRFLTPMVLQQCIAVIENNITNIDEIKLELLRVSSIYGIESLKKKLIKSFMNANELRKFGCETLLKVADECNLKELKRIVSIFMKETIDVDNCSNYLDQCEEFSLQQWKTSILLALQEWDYTIIPENMIIELTKCAFKHEVMYLKRLLRWCIFRLTDHELHPQKDWDIRKENNEVQNTDATFNWFLRKYEEEIFELPAELSRFIIMSTCTLTL